MASLPQHEIELIPTNLSPEEQEERRKKAFGEIGQDEAFSPQMQPENAAFAPAQTPMYAPQEAAVSGSLNASEAVKATTVSSGNGNKGWAILGGALLLGGIGAAAAGGGGGKKSDTPSDNTSKPTAPTEPTLSAPEITVDKVADLAHNHQNQTLTLSGSLKTDPNATQTDVFVSVNGGTAQAAKVLGDKWALDISGSDLTQKQGENAIAVSAVSHDKNGKTVYANNVLANYFVDTQIATPKVTLNDIADKLSTETQQITLSGSLNNVDADASAVVRVQINKGAAKTAQVSGNTWTLTVPASEMVGKLGENRVDVSAVATDKFGNSASHAANDTFQVYAPIIAPTISFDSKIEIKQANQTQNFTLSGSLKNDPNALKTDVFVIVNGKQHLAKISGETWSLNISGSELAQKQGNQTLEVKAVSTDRFQQNVPSQTVSGSYFVDTQIATPKVTLNDITDKLFTETQQITLSGSLNNVDADASAVVRVQINKGAAKTAQVSDNTWTLDVPASEMVGKLGANRVDVSAVATDKFGNTAQHSVGDDFHVYAPIVAPTVSFDSKIEIKQANQTQNFTLSGSLKNDPNALKTDVFVIVNGKQHLAKISGETWSLNISGSELAQKQGNQILEVKAVSTDRFQQNVPSETVSGSYFVDTKIATPKVTLNEIADKLTTETQPITLSGSLNGVDADASAVVRVQINNGEMKTAKVSGNTWTLDVPASEMVGKLGANRVDVSAIATDKFGNSAQHSASDVYDVIAPTETQIFYASGKMDSVSGSTAQAFDGKGLSDKGKIFDNEEKILAAYAQFHDKIDVSKPTYPFGSIGIGAVFGGILGNIPKDYNKVTTPTIEKNIEKAYATDRDKDGVIDAFDRNPNTWDVSERDLRLFATMAYGKTLQQKNGINQSTNDISEILKSAYGKDTHNQFDFKDELIGKWEVLEAFSDGEVFGTGADYTVFGNGKKADGSYENVVVAFRGTQATSFKDIWADLNVASGSLPSQVAVMEELAEKIMSQYQPKNVYSTGHSLGGYLAQYFAAHTMQTNVQRQHAFKHSALFNPAKLTADDDSEQSLKSAIAKTNQMVRESWQDNTDKTLNLPKHKTDSYVITGEWVSAGFHGTVEDITQATGVTAGAWAGAKLGSIFGPAGTILGGIFGAIFGKKTAETITFKGLGEYYNTTNFDFKSGETWGKHDMSSFYERNSKLNETFSKGYRMDKHYLFDDHDKDGLTDYQEKRIGTDFRTATNLNGKDTDQDGFSDHLEIKLGSQWQNADDIVEVRDFVAQNEWDSPILAVAATHTSDNAKTFLGAMGYLLSPTAKGNDLSYTPNGETVDLSVLTQQDWDDWLYSGSQLHNGTNGNDDLTGASSLNNATRLLYGGAGDDTVHGSDVLAIMIGGAGEDTFKFKASNLISDWTTVIGNGHNIVVDFAQGDKLDFSASRELFSDRNANFKWSDVLGETAAAFQNQSALIWQDASKTLAYKSSQSHDLHVFARFDDSQTFASIQAGLIG